MSEGGEEKLKVNEMQDTQNARQHLSRKGRGEENRSQWQCGSVIVIVRDGDSCRVIALRGNIK